jgi:hypothetical protein
MGATCSLARLGSWTLASLAVGTGCGYLLRVTAWRRFGFGAVGNLIVYDDRFVLAACSDWDRLNPLAGRSRYERLAREQVALPPEVRVGRNSRNWAVRFADVSSARCHATAYQQRAEQRRFGFIVAGVLVSNCSNCANPGEPEDDRPTRRRVR